MKMYLAALLAVGCAKPAATTPQDGPTIKKLEALGNLMKNEINPAFSKLVFLLAHADEEPQTIRAELGIAGTNLRVSIGKLREWHNPPTESQQGRDVFLTYAASIDTMTVKLIDSIGRDDRRQALSQLEEIADTCNNCHHFFRLKVDDSVVTRTAAAGPTASTVPTP